MNKLGGVAIIVFVVGVLYLLLMAVFPVLTDVVNTANTSMAASSNMSNYPGTTEALLASPWFLWFVPGCIGMIAIVIHLKRQ